MTHRTVDNTPDKTQGIDVMRITIKTPERLTAQAAIRRAKAADRIARGTSVYPATGQQRLQAKRLARAYLSAAEVLAEVDSE